MDVISTVSTIQEKIMQLKATGKTVGFVPTMGFLHEGHLSLVEKAKNENDIVIMSIFVNPLQFGPNEDFDRYPRDIKRDTMLAIEAGVDILFHPQVEDMYPEPLSMKVIVEKGVNVLCGKTRPGHFDGVATVVLKLFQIVMPTRAYFGMKDAQQVAVIENMIRDFHLPVQLVRCETLREKDGLAKSSRNVYLLPQERDEAAVLYESLHTAKKRILEGETCVTTVKKEMKDLIEKKTSSSIDYVEILSYPQLAPIQEKDGEIIIAIAVKFSKARLIDNLIVLKGGNN